MQEERKKREFFQRRVHRLKKALRSESVQESSKTSEKMERSRSESSPEPSIRIMQESVQHESEVEKTINSSHSEAERKLDSSSAERSMSRREIFDSFVSPHHTPPTTSPIKFPFHSILPPTDV